MKHLNTIKLKLKRHNIKFDYNPNLNQIEIEKSKNIYQKLLWAALFLILGIILFIVAVNLLMDIGRSRRLIKKLFLIIPMGLIFLGGMEIHKYFKLSKNNQRKIISPESIIIEADTKTTIKKEEIIDLDVFIEGPDDIGESIGTLYLLTKTSKDKIVFLKLSDKNYRYLKDDLDFLKNNIKEYMNL